MLLGLSSVSFTPRLWNTFPACRTPPRATATSCSGVSSAASIRRRCLFSVAGTDLESQSVPVNARDSASFSGGAEACASVCRFGGSSKPFRPVPGSMEMPCPCRSLLMQVRSTAARVPKEKKVSVREKRCRARDSRNPVRSTYTAENPTSFLSGCKSQVVETRKYA